MDINRTLLVAKLEASWIVLEGTRGQVLHRGSFMEAWSAARELARTRPATAVIAVNDVGEVVAREEILPRG